MAHYEKQGKQKAAYPIPISLPLMPHCPVTVLQRYRDGVCNLLVPLFFIMSHPSIPLYFEEMIFTLVSPIIDCIYLATITGGKPLKKQW